jgi:hypothetical protein
MTQSAHLVSIAMRDLPFPQGALLVSTVWEAQTPT